MNKHLTLVLFIFIAVLYSCSKEKQPDPTPTKKPTTPVSPSNPDTLTSLAFQSDTATVTVNQILKLQITGKPVAVSDSSLIYTSSDTTVATVNNFCAVFGKKAGNVIITATNKNKTVKAICKVKSVFVPVKYINLSGGTVQMGVQDTVYLVTFEEPTTSSLEVIKWSSTDESIATVSTGGLVIAHKLGTVKIIAKAPVAGVADTCTIQVKPLDQIFEISTTYASSYLIQSYTYYEYAISTFNNHSINDVTINKFILRRPDNTVANDFLLSYPITYIPNTDNTIEIKGFPETFSSDATLLQWPVETYFTFEGRDYMASYIGSTGTIKELHYLHTNN